MEFDSELAKVGSLLERYVKVDKSVFGFSLRSLIPIPGLFKSIPFEQHSLELELIEQELMLVRGEFETEEVLRFVAKYVDSLSDSVSCLKEICRKLDSESQNPGSYRSKDYKADLVSYKNSVERYAALGAELNRLA